MSFASDAMAVCSPGCLSVCCCCVCVCVFLRLPVLCLVSLPRGLRAACWSLCLFPHAPRTVAALPGTPCSRCCSASNSVLTDSVLHPFAAATVIYAGSLDERRRARADPLDGWQLHGLAQRGNAVRLSSSSLLPSLPSRSSHLNSCSVPPRF